MAGTMMAAVTLSQVLLHCDPSSVTIDQVRRLVALVGPEVPTVEYKADMSQTIAKAVAALANTYGGLVLVGVTDDRKVQGVKEKTIEAVAQHCHNKLDPPWVPEIVPVAMDDGSGCHVLLLRVVPGHAPRPLLLDGAAPVRHHNTTQPAGRQRLAALFAEASAAQPASLWTIPAPQLPDTPAGRPDETVDMVIRSGLLIGMDPRARWRPLRERHVDSLAEALNHSPLPGALVGLVSSGHSGCGIHRFGRHGYNRSHVIGLRWQAFPSGWSRGQPVPVEASLSVTVPGGYGQPATHLQAHLDVTLRIGGWLKQQETQWRSVSASDPRPPLEGDGWRMSFQELTEVIEAMTAALTAAGTVGAFAELAQIVPEAMPQPRALHLVTHRSVTDTFDTQGLRAISEAGSSRGGHVLADPDLDLADPVARREQVHAWLAHIALDAGLLGMEKLLNPLESAETVAGA